MVGDVAGHGVRAAVTMGRLRTAIQTLAMLELPPAESLQQLNELMRMLGEREPHFATCVYALYDAVHGHLRGRLGRAPAPAAGPARRHQRVPRRRRRRRRWAWARGPIRSRTFEIEDGSLLVLYTDGLVESRDRDIDDGLNRLRDVFGAESAARPLEDLCKATLAGVYADQQRDDIAMLIARLSRIDGRPACRPGRCPASSPRRARRAR